MGDKSDTGSTLRAQLRAAALGADLSGRTVIEWQGKKYEVRVPTMAQQRKWERACKGKDGTVDATRMSALVMIGTVYVPGTEEPVFEPADEDGLLELGLHKNGLLRTISEAQSSLTKASVEEEGKNSESTPT